MKTPLDELYTWEELYERFAKRFPKKSKKHGFKKWFMDNKADGKLFDDVMIARCFTIYLDMLKLDKDHFLLVTGGEGLGKSTLAIQLGSWIDPNFVLENLCFSPEEYIKRLKTIKKGGCLILDEGGVMLFSRETMSVNNVLMTKIFMLQRQKNVSVILCCPSFWDIDAYLRRHRVNTMIRIYKQGHYMGYLPKALRIINEVGYRKKPLTMIKLPSESFWHGTFRKIFPKSIERSVYLSQKKKHLDTFLDTIEEDFKRIQRGKKKKHIAGKSLGKGGFDANPRASI